MPPTMINLCCLPMNKYKC